MFAILPPLVGFIGLLSRKPLDEIRDDMTFAAIASVPIALLSAVALITSGCRGVVAEDVLVDGRWAGARQRPRGGSCIQALRFEIARCSDRQL